MAERYRVLVVEDSPAVAELIRRALEAAGLDVAHVADLASAREHLAVHPADVVVLDVGLPDGSGLHLLRELQAAGGAPVPVVILSGRQEEVDRVAGLELGAEDYVVKPFFPRELATRVRRAAGRTRGEPSATALDFGALHVDLGANEVTVDGHRVELTNREFRLLAHLASRPRRVLGRDELLRDVWESSPEWQSPRTVTEHIRRLRRKIEDDPSAPRWIITHRRVGYSFDP